MPDAQVVGMNKGGAVDIGAGFKAAMVHAVHSSSCGSGSCVVDGGSAGGFVVQCPNGTAGPRPGAGARAVWPSCVWC